MIDIGGNIRKYRKAKGLTQNELAEIIGSSQHRIANYERGIREPRLSTIEAIANALDVTVPELLGYEVAECKSLSDYHTDELLRELWRRAK